MVIAVDIATNSLMEMRDVCQVDSTAPTKGAADNYGGRYVQVDTLPIDFSLGVTVRLAQLLGVLVSP